MASRRASFSPPPFKGETPPRSRQERVCGFEQEAAHHDVTGYGAAANMLVLARLADARHEAEGRRHIGSGLTFDLALIVAHRCKKGSAHG